MKAYTFGNKNNPAIMLLPGTCCHWNGNFEKVIPLLYPFVHYGKFKLKLLQKRLERRKKEMPEYVGEFRKSFGEARQYVTKRSCKNQFYSDLVTPLPDKINPKGTEIHIFMRLKWEKNIVPAICGILQNRLFMSKTFNMRNFLCDILKNGQSL